MRKSTPNLLWTVGQSFGRVVMAPCNNLQRANALGLGEPFRAFTLPQEAVRAEDEDVGTGAERTLLKGPSPVP